MGIPGSRLNGLDFDPKQLGSIVYPSLGTFLRNTSTNVGGQKVNTFTAIDGAHTNIPCRKAPPVLIRPQHQEHTSGQFRVIDAQWQVNFDRYIADASDEWQLVIDGTTYQVVSVEHDGQGLTTRVGVGDIQPYNP